MAKLSPQSLAVIYTGKTDDLLAKIADYETLLERASAGGYTLDTTQGRQSGSPPDTGIDSISETLEAYIGAYKILTGQIIERKTHVNFTP